MLLQRLKAINESLDKNRKANLIFCVVIFSLCVVLFCNDRWGEQQWGKHTKWLIEGTGVTIMLLIITLMNYVRGILYTVMIASVYLLIWMLPEPIVRRIGAYMLISWGVIWCIFIVVVLWKREDREDLLQPFFQRHAPLKEKSSALLVLLLLPFMAACVYCYNGGAACIAWWQKKRCTP